jgi:formate dehydrogenase maturation protein FdhE
MKTYVVTNETLEKLLDGFVSHDEYCDFIANLVELCEEVVFAHGVVKRSPKNDFIAGLALAKMIVMYAGFNRDNVEIVKSLISNIKFEEDDATRREDI